MQEDTSELLLRPMLLICISSFKCLNPIGNVTKSEWTVSYMFSQFLHYSLGGGGLKNSNHFLGPLKICIIVLGTKLKWRKINSNLSNPC